MQTPIMSETEPLKQQEEVKNEEVKNDEPGRTTTIDTSALEQDKGKWESEAKFSRFWSVVLYTTLMSFDLVGAASMMTYLVARSKSWGWKPWVNNLTYALLMVLSILMILYGLITIFRFGGTTRLIQNLEALTDLIASQAAQFALQANSLTDAVKTLEVQTQKAKNRESNFNEILQIGKEIGRLGNKINVDNKEMGVFFEDISLVQKAVSLLKRQIIKNEMMVKFYQYEMNDGIEGLNKEEYELFLNSLDKGTADTWHDIGLSWRNLKGEDDIIDAVEFESALDLLFNALDAIDAETVKEFNRKRKAIF